MSNETLEFEARPRPPPGPGRGGGNGGEGGAPPRRRRGRGGRLRRVLARVLPFLLVLGLGAAAIAFLLLSRPSPPRKKTQRQDTLVEVVRVARGSVPVSIHAQGQVIPAEQVIITPLVQGEVEWMSEQLIPGGLFSAGEPMVRINAEEFQLRVAQAESEVQRARVELREQLARRRVARAEWEMLRGLEGVELPPASKARPLALQEPQVAAAREALESARSARERARLDLRRTELRAPFNALILEEQVDPGQVVSPRDQLVTLVGTDSFWVKISIPVDKILFLQGPGLSEDPTGARVRVWQELPSGRIERAGRVLRLQGRLAEAGNMAQVLVRIEDPLGLRRGPGEREAQPLLLGSWVQVAVEAGALSGVVPVPRRALRENDTVYVRGRDGRLRLRQVRVVWELPERVLVSEGLRGGEEVVLTPLSEPVEGMRLRVRPPEAPPSQRPRDTGVGGGGKDPGDE